MKKLALLTVLLVTAAVAIYAACGPTSLGPAAADVDETYYPYAYICDPSYIAFKHRYTPQWLPRYVAFFDYDICENVSDICEDFGFDLTLDTPNSIHQGNAAAYPLTWTGRWTVTLTGSTWCGINCLYTEASALWQTSLPTQWVVEYESVLMPSRKFEGPATMTFSREGVPTAPYMWTWQSEGSYCTELEVEDYDEVDFKLVADGEYAQDVMETYPFDDIWWVKRVWPDYSNSFSQAVIKPAVGYESDVVISDYVRVAMQHFDICWGE